MNIQSAEFIKSGVKPADFIKDHLPQIAFAGRSNVGKSSLINSLLSRKNIAKTSRTPGRTQLVNFFKINGTFYFVDLPGYGYAKVPLSVKKTWNRMIESYLKDNPALRLLVFILDIRHEPSPLDRTLQEWLTAWNVPYVCVATKSDKISRSAQARQFKIIRDSLSLPESVLLIPCSAKTKLGCGEIWMAIEDSMKNEK
ncbi:YihA family ribosome biogenesis GTP-binding protein [Candidatus Sumerlaeota bacterium]|nr:YihA family ribosome biogenesis GTP-binding protein [Candidatus Sumerlaeota bacterium]